MSWLRKDIQRLAFVFSLCDQTATHCPVTQRRLFGTCTYCDVCTEIRVALQTCIASGRNLFTYPFKQHRIEPQDHARPWFGTSLLRVTTRTKGVLASVYMPY